MLLINNRELQSVACYIMLLTKPKEVKLMPFYEIRYKKVKDGVKKRYAVAPIFEKAGLKTQLPFD
jgi:hypothetical protein